MPRSVRHSVEARADLKSIRRYLEEVDAEAAADRLLHDIAGVLAKFTPEDRREMADEHGMINVDCAFCAKSFPVPAEPAAL